mmetsp:Transcript_111263/g.346839  ORF Transcript_111263/g.346839 Transcript_111263/m.346839 type:complete len:143 (-) Transcript_111263:291-719(-)
MEKISLLDDIPLPPRGKKKVPPIPADRVDRGDIFAYATGTVLQDNAWSAPVQYEQKQRWVVVHTEDGDESVEVDNDRGPVWIHAKDGYKGIHEKVGFRSSGGCHQWGNKPWYEMSSTEREVVLVQIAKHQQFLKRGEPGSAW